MKAKICLQKLLQMLLAWAASMVLPKVLQESKSAGSCLCLP